LNQADIDAHWMRKAIQLARKAEKRGEVPVGAVVVRDGILIGEGLNCPIGSNDPGAHAEMVALREAGRVLENYRLPGIELYVTLEPCAMCAGAMVHARVRRVIYGTPDPRTGAAGSVMDILRTDTLNHRCEVTTGILQWECADMIAGFFRERR
jgi:tRNA(adenine34) deaminase